MLLLVIRKLLSPPVKLTPVDLHHEGGDSGEALAALLPEWLLKIGVNSPPGYKKAPPRRAWDPSAPVAQELALSCVQRSRNNDGKVKTQPANNQCCGQGDGINQSRMGVVALP